MRPLLSILFMVAPNMTYDLIRKQLSKTVPFAKHAGVEIERIDKCRAVTRLPFRPEGLNRIGTVLEIRPVAAEAAIRFLAVAKAPVRAEAQVKGNADDLMAEVKTDGKSVFQVAVNLTGEDGAKVAEMSVDWHVSMKRS